MNTTEYYSHVQQAPSDVICAYEDLPLSEKALFLIMFFIHKDTLLASI